MHCTSSLPPLEDTIYQFSSVEWFQPKQIFNFSAIDSVLQIIFCQSVYKCNNTLNSEHINWYFLIVFSADDKIPSRCASFDYDNRRPFQLFAYILPYGVQVVNKLYKKNDPLKLIIDILIEFACTSLDDIYWGFFFNFNGDFHSVLYP